MKDITFRKWVLCIFFVWIIVFVTSCSLQEAADVGEKVRIGVEHGRRVLENLPSNSLPYSQIILGGLSLVSLSLAAFGKYTASTAHKRISKRKLEIEGLKDN